MNIFVTHPNPRASANFLPDKHVVKMPLESCQMLSIIFSKSGIMTGELLTKWMVRHTTHKKVLFAIIPAPREDETKISTIPHG